MSKTRVDVLEGDEGVTPERVQPYVRSCIAAESADEHIKSQGLDMEFVISFLGTGGGAPSQHRNGSCTALRLGGQTFLFDTCEGTLRQLEHTTIKPISITKIFISHLHGDHVYGLVPVILSILVAHKAALHNPSAQYQKRRAQRDNGGKPRVQIYGPPGLYNYLCMVLTLSCAKINFLQVDVIELVGGRNERGPTHKKGQRNPFLSHYPEFAMPSVSRKYLEKSKDGIWIIDAPESVDKAIANKGVLADKWDGFHRLPNDVNLGIDRRLHIKAAEIDHITGVQTFGFSVEEQQPPGTIDVEKAKSLGIMPSKKYSLLKCGIAVPTDDNTGMVQPEEVLSQIFRPRKFALIADHRLVFKEMEGLAEDSDLVIHEATLSKTDGVKVRTLPPQRTLLQESRAPFLIEYSRPVQKIKIRGHNNAFNAGKFAKDRGCHILALNHFGSTSVTEEHINNVLEEAREGNENSSEVVATYDFLEIRIPRGGFNFRRKGTTTKESDSVRRGRER